MEVLFTESPDNKELDFDVFSLKEPELQPSKLDSTKI